MRKNNLILYITSFLSGMTVMAVELSCSRLLAPYFSSSQIVWSVIIGLIMICMSIGNVLGGRSADKHKSLGRLYFYIWIASVWIAVIPFVSKYLIALIAGLLMLVFPGSNLVVAGSAISCLVIFSLPMTLLGMVSPYLVKLGVEDTENKGRIAGQIYAMGTIGSIIGTFAPTFLTIPYIGTSKTFLLFALLLNIVCALYFLFSKKNALRNTITAILILVFMLIPLNDSYAFWKSNILYEGESLYNYLQVEETETSIILSTNVAFGVQSIYKKDGSLSGYYYEYALMAPYFINDMSPEKELDVLVLGLGTGTFPKQLKKYIPNVAVDAVEIDAKIADLATEYFNLKEDEANVFINDGRSFFSTPDAKQYDIILADAYQDITVPFHMSTKEFFQIVKEHLKPGGILIVNVNMKSGSFTGVPEYLANTVKSIFNKVYRADLTQVTNSLLFVSDDNNMIENYNNNVKAQINKNHDLYYISKFIGENLVEMTDDTLVLTDDLAPVEILGQKALAEIVKEEVAIARKQIEGKNLREIFEYLTN
ncbi:MAG: fused MFS/spermidine synthase [Clostridiaceae bacterium]|jgi:spermidine synthase|nr:fused MFS/spermidine synthase [Clostridiaceae bacterium]